MTNLIAQTPQMAGSVLSALFPPLRAVVLPGMGAQSAGGAYAPGRQLAGCRCLKGGAGGGREASAGVSTAPRLRWLNYLVPLQGQVLSSIGKENRCAIRAVTGQGIAGAVEEAVTQILQNGVDRFAEGKNTDILDGVGQAAVLGAFMEGPMAAPTRCATCVLQTAGDAFDEAFAADVADRDFQPGSLSEYERRAATDLNFSDPTYIDPRQTVRPHTTCRRHRWPSPSAASPRRAAERDAGGACGTGRTTDRQSGDPRRAAGGRRHPGGAHPSRPRGVTRVGPSTIAQADDYADFTADALAVERASGCPGAVAGTADSGVVQGDLLEHANLVLLSWLQMELPDEPMALLALRTWLFGATPEVCCTDRPAEQGRHGPRHRGPGHDRRAHRERPAGPDEPRHPGGQDAGQGSASRC